MTEALPSNNSTPRNLPRAHHFAGKILFAVFDSEQGPVAGLVTARCLPGGIVDGTVCIAQATI